MARKFEEGGDNAYNARRRYYRSAERNLKKAEESSGASAARYRAVARQDLENAFATYDSSAPKQKISEPIRNLASKMGIDLEGQRSKFIAATPKQREQAISRSEIALESSKQNDAIRREYEAYALVNQTSIGRRIIGATVDIWRDTATDLETGMIDRSKIIPALFDYFNVNSLADLIDKIEDMVGEALYADEDSDAMYEAVKIMILIKTADNSVTV